MKDTFLASLQESLHELLSEDPTILVMGEDILDPYGGAFKVTKELSTNFPAQVITTPISEAGFLGIANGLALRGMKPIVEIMFGDFVTLGADQIINYAAKFRGMYQAELDFHYVVRLAVGAGRGYGPTHSQTLEKLFLGIPNLKVIAPSKYHDPGQLLRTAINDQGPILFLEHKLLYSKQLGTGGFTTRCSKNQYPIVRISNTDRSDLDITIVTYGGALWIEPLLDRLAAEEIWAEAILPSSLNEVQYPEMIDSITRSKHAIIVEEGAGPFGWGAQVAHSLTKACWGTLRKPIQTITSANTIIPTAQQLEAQFLPNVESIEKTVYEVLA
jgi:pyruvate/2-oxoglutarate/acetoin dehydrogenase E1 component